MTITLVDLHAAMTALSEATPETRAQRMTELMAAGTAFAAVVAQHEQQLEEDSDWLDANPDDPEFSKREERYLKRLRWYEKEHRALGEALLMVKDEEGVI